MAAQQAFRLGFVQDVSISGQVYFLLLLGGGGGEGGGERRRCEDVNKDLTLLVLNTPCDVLLNSPQLSLEFLANRLGEFHFSSSMNWCV